MRSCPRLPLWALVLGFAVIGCNDGDRPSLTEVTPQASVVVTATPSGSAASPTPPPVPPEPTAEELATIDQVIALALAGDNDGLRLLASGSFTPCEIQHSGPGGGPVCLDGEAAGTTVESIGVGGCDGAVARLEDVQLLPDGGPVSLVAVYRPRISTADAHFFHALFDGPDGKFHFTVTPGRISNINHRCVGAAPIVVGAAVAQWVTPPLYQTFAAEGRFEGVVDEPGDVDPFLWRFPASGTADHVYRVYWNRGTVLACNERRCGESPLVGAEALKRIAVTPLDSRICVRGWRDDVGNIQARLLTPALEGTCAYSRTPVGIRIIDDTIRAVESQDVEALVDLIEYRPLGCVEVAQLSTPPQCEPGQPIGTPIDTFMFVLCDGGPMPRDQVPQLVRNTLDAYTLELYAVVRPATTMDNEQYRIIFTWPRDGRPFWLNLTENGVVGLWGGCGAYSPAELAEGEVIVAPLYEP